MSIYFVVLGSSILFVLPLGSYLYINEHLSLSKFILFLIISFVYATPLIKFFGFTESMQIVTENERSIREILDIEEIVYTDDKVVLKDYTITFEDVRFGYDEKEILKGINLTAKEGEVTALIGPSEGGLSYYITILFLDF